ncbi:MAG: hypothetical protein DRH90_22805 [Deltaproteobacteria bacterium]|nr:MAG: hypothetical protein DRH90_22805 [Deltaproteobacteria bacterium]
MYLFFVRHFNDIDHITPVVWKLQKDNYQVAVFCMNLQYDIQQDYRLRFLKDQGVIVDYLYDAFYEKRDPFHQCLYTLIRASYKAQRKLVHDHHGPARTLPTQLGRLVGFAGTGFYKIARMIYYGRRWARSVLERTNAQTVCFDYIMPKAYSVDAFLKAARQMSIPVLALPHGVQLYTNEITKPKSTETRRFAKFNRFDYIIASDKLRKDILVKAGVAENKIAVLGSARYCRSWLEKNNEIVPKTAAKFSGSSEKLRVVLMPSKPQCRLDLERMFVSCQLIAELDGIQAMIKPHTRTNTIHQFGNYPLPDVSHVLTADLCGWADVLLVVGSSVITEALMRGKPVLYLKYLHDNTTFFEELGACWIIHNELELKNALVSLQARKADVPYSQKSVTDFLSEIVYGGDSNRDVLDAYEEFIVNCTLKKQSTSA